MTDGMLSLSWNNHSTTFCHMLSQLRHKERYTDATVACEGKFYPVHKLVLSTCSQYFEDMFEHTLGKHPVVLLQDVRRDELEALLSYMYAGIVSVAQRDLARLIKVAELLQIKGLAVPDEIPIDKKNTANDRSLSSERTSPPSKVSQGIESSDDRSSPHPKRRRREESGTPSRGGSSPTHAPDSPKAPLHTKDSNQMQESSKNCYSVQEQVLDDVHQRVEDLEQQSGGDRREHTEKSNTNRTAQQRNDHQVNQRLNHQPTTQDSSRNQFKDGGEEAIIIKEEAWEDPGDNQINSMNASMGYGPSVEDSSAGGMDGIQEDHTKLLLPKDYESQGHPGQLPQALPEVVVEALAGPSSMHEWLGGGDFTAGLSAVENYSGEGSPPTADHPQQHQMAKNDGKAPSARGATRAKMNLTVNPRLLKCEHCSYFTAKKHELITHMQTHTEDESFSCHHCHSQFSDKYALHRHLNLYCEKNGEISALIFTCNYCPFTTHKQSELIKHINSHSSQELSIVIHYCNFCSYSTFKKSYFLTHINTHTSERPYSCPYCACRFVQKSTLSGHLLIHKGKKSHTCPKCHRKKDD
ncbi:longitudinals lacking protein, isoforms H/M/V-like isoform X1 [Homarus americanus]|uniref:longitudinals lacking protein, isoforms H/M/V-like isoform X1 n=1 Tax=Homarus americanus TaxID=6706 RepID=UPI001C4937B1|nr:longitudinals lacking protein, isoforms H/M/V-like isoform X1 [Homarus americanus]